MDDEHWSEEIKRRQEEKVQGQRTTAALHLHIDGFIQAKLPEFWDALLDCIEKDVARANKTLPHLECRAVSKDKSNIWIQRKRAQPLKGVRLILNLKGHTIKVVQDGDIDSVGNPIQTVRTEIQVSVILQTGEGGTPSREILSFRYGGEEFEYPVPLSKALLKFLYGD